MAHPRQGEVYWAKLDPAIDAEPALRILRAMFA